MIDFSSPLQGLTNAETRFDSAVQKLASDPDAGGDPSDAVEILMSKNQFEASVKALQATDNMAKATLDILK